MLNLVFTLLVFIVFFVAISKCEYIECVCVCIYIYSYKFINSMFIIIVQYIALFKPILTLMW